MTRYTLRSCLATVTLIIVSFLFLSGCSESVISPLALDSPTDHAGFPEQKDADSDDTLFGDNANARDSRILRTRSGELLSAADFALQFESDAIPADIDPRVAIKNPSMFMFNVEPEGTVLNSPIQITIDYSKADLEGVNEETLKIYQISGGHLSPVPTIVDGSGNLVSFRITEFARYALARD